MLSEPERFAHAARPRRDVEAMPPEQSERDAFEPKPDARRVRGRSVGEMNVEGVAEMVLVIVARHARRRISTSGLCP